MPPVSFAFGPMNYQPQLVILFIGPFEMAGREYCCIPRTPANDALLNVHNSLAYYPRRARNANIPEPGARPCGRGHGRERPSHQLHRASP